MSGVRLRVDWPDKAATGGIAAATPLALSEIPPVAGFARRRAALIKRRGFRSAEPKTHQL